MMNLLSNSGHYWQPSFFVDCQSKSFHFLLSHLQFLAMWLSQYGCLLHQSQLGRETLSQIDVIILCKIIIEVTPIIFPIFYWLEISHSPITLRGRGLHQVMSTETGMTGAILECLLHIYLRIYTFFSQTIGFDFIGTAFTTFFSI